MTTGRNLVIFALMILGFIFLFRLYVFSLKKKYGLRLVVILYLFLLFCISFFFYFLRIYLLSRLGICLSDLCSVAIVGIVLNFSGEDIIPNSGTSGSANSEMPVRIIRAPSPGTQVDVFEIPPSPAQVQEVSNAKNPITAETQLNHPSQSEAGGPSGVSPSTPSSPTPSWFEGAVNYYQNRFGDQGEEPSSAQNLGHLPQGGEAPGQPAGEREPEAPTIGELTKKMERVLRGHRKLRANVLKDILNDIKLEAASPKKRIQINESLDYISNNRDYLLNSGQSLVYEFTVRVNDWEREQRHFPNTVDDVP